jgi:coproporphyrinogen III oxidase
MYQYSVILANVGFIKNNIFMMGTLHQWCLKTQQGLIDSLQQSHQWHTRQHRMGTGHSATITHGSVIEKGVISVSRIAGDHLPSTSLEQNALNVPFEATGLSLILHPLSPYHPTAHLNVRYFETRDTQWLGAGWDLTPFVIDSNVNTVWHRTTAELCQPFGTFLTWHEACNRYFYLTHRQEYRGIGGFFVDKWQPNASDCNLFLTNLPTLWWSAYGVLLQNNTPFTQEDRTFQAMRRARYVEFNLLQDRGTWFGLQSGGDPDAVLASMPPMATWHLDHPWQARHQALCAWFEQCAE